MSIEDRVKQLVIKHAWEMADDSSLSSGDNQLLPEDAEELLSEYFTVFNIDDSSFDFRRYYPNAGIWFLPNCILPRYLKTDKNAPEPLTIEMLVTCAKAGRWIY